MLVLGSASMALALSVPQEMNPPVRVNAYNERPSAKKTAPSATSFRSNYSGNLQFPKREEARNNVQAQAGLPTLYGSVIYNDDWENVTNWNNLYGYYSFQPTSSPKLSAVALHPNLYVNGGGCYSNRMIHYHLWEMYADDNSDTGITFNDFYCVVNTDTWSFVNNPESNSVTDAYVCYDMTYDPVSQSIYALQWGYYEDTYCNLAKVDPMTGNSTDIARLPSMCVLAANNFGQLFGVSFNDGTTYYIDKATGDIIPLGSTGVKPQYSQSATVDPETNTIYWAATLSNGDGILYTIDTTTGGITKIANMPGNAEVTGLFIEADRKGLNAPAQLQDLSLTSKDNQATISYKIPTQGFDGSSLSGSVNTYVYVDGNLAFSKAGQPGEAVTGNFNVSSGSHTVVAYASNAAGDGMKTYRRQTTGKDVPAAPGNVTLSISGGKANLQWTAPTQGLNGGEFDPSALTYTVKRFPGEQVVAMSYKETSFTETLPAGTATYYYEVTSYADGEEGGTARSNAEFVGSAFTVPCTWDFEDENSMDGFTLIANEEGRGWYRWVNVPLDFKAAASKFNMNTQSDNWMICPTVTLEAGKEYHLNFRERVFSADDPEKFEVTIGNAATKEAQTTTLLKVQTVKNEEWLDYSIAFKVETTGNYNVAFHCVSPAYAYYLIIDDISITDSSNFVDTPLPVTNLKVRESDGNAVVTWTAPTKGVLGGDLKASDLSYEIYDSDGTLLESNFKGTSYTDTRFADKDSQKFIYYQVTPIHGEKKGEATLSDFVVLGPDYALPFKESFSNTGLDNTPWSLSTLAGNYTGCWQIKAATSNPSCEPYDNDGGMATFVAYELPTGTKARLTSPKIDLLTPAHPVLKFYVYKPGTASNETLTVEISHNDFAFETLATVNLKDANGWQPVEIEIPRKYCKESTMISFTGTSGYGQNVSVDCITILDDPNLAQGIDLQAADIEVPAEMMPGQEKEFRVTIFNAGAETVTDYTVSLLCDGVTVNSTKGEKIEPGETYIYIFKATAEQEDYMHTYRFQGMVSCQGDINPDNDKTEVKEITIGLQAGVGSIDGLTIGASNGAIRISGADGETAYIFTMDGRVVETVRCEGTAVIPVENGIYLVKVGNITKKVRV